MKNTELLELSAEEKLERFIDQLRFLRAWHTKHLLETKCSKILCNVFKEGISICRLKPEEMCYKLKLKRNEIPELFMCEMAVYMCYFNIRSKEVFEDPKDFLELLEEENTPVTSRLATLMRKRDFCWYEIEELVEKDFEDIPTEKVKLRDFLYGEWAI